MSASNLVNSIGLLLDIVGAVLIWLYGLPAEVHRGGAVHLIGEEVDATEAEKAKRFDFVARWGIALLITGFLVQLVSNFL